MSTVFEKEPWIRHRNDTKLATNTEYKTHYENRPHSDRGPAKPDNGFDNQLNGFGNDRAQTEYPNGNNNDMSAPSIQSLVALLPPGHYLPSDPVNFDSRQRQMLLDTASDDLRGTTTAQIQSAYQILSRFDRELSGWLPIEKVRQAFEECKVKMINVYYLLPTSDRVTLF